MGHSLALVCLLEVKEYWWCHHWLRGFPKVPQTHWPVLPEVGKEALSLSLGLCKLPVWAGPGAQTSMYSGRVPLPNQSPFFPRLPTQVFLVQRLPSHCFDPDGACVCLPLVRNWQGDWWAVLLCSFLHPCTCSA